MPFETPWRELSRSLISSAPYRDLRERLGEVKRLPVPVAAWISELLAHDLDRRLLVVVPHESEALAWTQAIELLGADGEFFATPSLTPYQGTETSLSVRAQEAVAVDRVHRGGRRTLVCTPRALFRRLPTKSVFERGVVELGAGGEVSIEDLAQHLLAHGYERRDLVVEVGEFAVRGGVFDVFSPGNELPLRLDLFGDVIDSVRGFDPVDQRSRNEIPIARVLPLSLFPAGTVEADRLADHLCEEGVSALGPEAAKRIEDLREEGCFPGWENYLPAIFRDATNLGELVGEQALGVIFDPQAALAEVDKHSADLDTDYRVWREQGLVAVPPEAIEVPAQEVRGFLAGSAVAIGGSAGASVRVAVGEPARRPTGAGPGSNHRPIDFACSSTDILQEQIPRFPREVETARARRERLLFVGRPEHRRRFENLTADYELAVGAGGVEYVEGELDRGFRLPGAGVVVFSERQLYRPIPRPRTGRAPRYGAFVSGLRDLKVGDFVVHEDHGIGQFIGLRNLGPIGEAEPELPSSLAPLAERERPSEGEVMEILYHAGQTLLLPPSRLDLVQRYSGVEGAKPRLDRLGGSSWVRTKEKVLAGMREMAVDLLRLYAEREVAEAPVMPTGDDLLSQFEAEFEYEATEDQLEAIAAIKQDLASRRPMDRLLCGDVGFGKTEVAMRAAFKAVSAGYQVAVLAPTTILADQHFETFNRRFSSFPVEIEMLSRFRSSAEIRDITKRLGENRIDVLIGTHRLLSKDVQLARLGLLVVDEEQRFGVAQKERLKELKKDVHVLAMTATPVPRTLQLSLAGVRDLSTIQMAPRNRMAVETSIVPFSPELIREVIEYELGRGGQVYYVHNRVAGISELAERLREICPQARLVIGHGQLGENKLARRMHAFKRGEYDLLLATTIIENGIDIPNVNTMIVHRAHQFGLAQLYQLRGRVGRSSRAAYCYLLTEPEKILSVESRRRLEAIQEFSELGSGFRVAARDLEIRGAGNLLGAEQSGHVAAVGLETYLGMLDQTVRELKGEEIEDRPAAAINLPVEAAIPEDYLADANLRMDFYRRIAAAETAESELLAELRDRFGSPPDPVLRLLEMGALKRLAEDLRVQSVSSSGLSLQIRFRKDTRAEVDRLIALVSSHEEFTFTPTGVLTIQNVSREDLVARAREVLHQVSPPAVVN
ncbi:MAG: transcription-repair coupling factor [Acidobacteriota bacterium]|nr:transcription-repair coupling factor [Acidobacteriota bacterium]